jgi:hypothetical protein
MDKFLTSGTLRLTLRALHDTGGPPLEAALRKAGWGPFLDNLPADDSALVGTLDDVTRLNQTIFGMLGEDLFRLYQRNTGQKMGEGARQRPWAAALIAQSATVPPERRLGWFVGVFVAAMGAIGLRYTVVEDATAWYLTPHTCLSCPGITAQQPVCAGTVAFVRMVGAPMMVGRPFTMAEVACRAVAGPDCRFAIYK